MSDGKGLDGCVGGVWGCVGVVWECTVMSAWTGMKSHQSAVLTFVAYWTRTGLV